MVLKVVTKTESWKEFVDQSIIDLLEDALAKAKTGEFKGVALVAETKDEMLYSYVSATSDRTFLMGALDRVKHRILMQIHNEEL